ncbi:amidohydrolase family protein [Granulicella cerasi]|uniref:Amidohydrolase family protein n=1 Tax=Granulicella cerasi TaxID=741063 RepID=A0ABW1ZBS0_9BACT|nr:amidohydrolase family protein [Granulicella cerasi]
MPEAAAWRFQKITAPIMDIPVEHKVLVGRVLTAVGDEVIENGFVEIKDGAIVAVGKASDRTDLDATYVVKTNGTILPGMFNSHAHLAWDGVHDLARQALDDSPEISAYKSATNMLKSLRAGITTVRDLGMNQSNFAAKQAVAQGIFPGPRLLICGEAIVQTGGHTYWCCREASGADEMRRAVREQVRGGADLIKIMASHDLHEFTDEELEAVIDETHRNGLPITAHATFDSIIHRVVKFGIDVVEHGGSLSDETIALLLERKVPIVTTFAPIVQQSVPEIARKFNVPDWKLAERQKAVADKSRYEGLKKAAEAGVPIVFGTDAGSPAVGHEVVSPEMQFMVKVGVVKDNYAAIRSATSVAAKMNKLDSKLGTLEAGKLADVVVVDGNPLEDLKALDNVTMTFVEGKRLV